MRSVNTTIQSAGGPLGFLTLDRMLTGPLIHLIYWAGLGLLAIAGFGAVGATAGIVLRETGLMGMLLSLVVLIVGLMVLLAFALIWRAVCEFFVAIFQISADLSALRAREEQKPL
jgi:hypothetical protein